MRCEKGKLMANRRVFDGFSISPPKSVSIVALYEEKRIVEIHDHAVRLEMTELEKFAETRVQKAGHEDSRRPVTSLRRLSAKRLRSDADKGQILGSSAERLQEASASAPGMTRSVP
jgi:hypothetical protein